MSADSNDLTKPTPDTDPRATVARPSGASDPSADTQLGARTPSAGVPPLDLPAVPGYAVRRELARGGMGAVYLARDPAFDRDVAVKVMHAGQDGSRFVVEAKVTAQLPHPGVPPVHALGALADGRPFLVMKLVEGRTLADEVRRAAGESAALLGAFEAICQTVGFAHSRDVIHRDLKPLNVMVGAFGEVQVMDWGLARQIRNAERGGDNESAAPALLISVLDETQAGEIKGTPAYMAPEQARGEPVDARADVFSLGGILAAILTGKPPFVGDSVIATVRKAADADLSDCFRQLDGCGADAELVTVAKKCLASEPDHRYAGGEEVARAVAAYRRGVEERLRAAERDQAADAARAAEQRRRQRQQTVMIAVMSLAGMSGFAGQQWYERREEQREAARELSAVRAEADRRATESRLEGERDSEARNKAEQARAGVTRSLSLATELRRQAKFKEAGAALAQALELATGGAPERALEVKQAQADLALVAQLDDIRYRKWAFTADPGDSGGSFRTEIVGPEYQRLFASQGLDPLSTPPAEVAARIAASPIKDEMVAALDDWALHNYGNTKTPELLETARRAAPAPWTDRLRDPALRFNFQNADVLKRLATEVDPATVPPAALTVLAQLMDQRGLDPSQLLAAARVKHPTNFELAFALAMWFSENRGDKPALQIGHYEAARALRPDNTVVLNNLGNALRRQGDLDGSAAVLREAIRLDPKYHTAHNNLGVTLKAKGDLPGAKDAYLEAIKQDPLYPKPYNNLAVLLKEEGDAKEAVAHWREAVRLDPQYASAHYHLGWELFYTLGDRAAGLHHLREAARLAPKSPSAHNRLGCAYRDAGQWDEALASLKMASDLDPKFPQPVRNAGSVRERRGELDAAATEYRKALALDPGYKLARADLDRVLKAKAAQQTPLAPPPREVKR